MTQRIGEVLFTPAQQLMIEDGAPACCFLTVEERRQGWEAHPPQAMAIVAPSAERRTPVDEKLLMELEQVKKAKTSARIILKQEDTTGKRWDVRRCRWIEDNLKGNMMSSYKDMTGPELAAAFNVMAASKAGLALGSKVVARFPDTATGVKRCEALAKLVGTSSQVPTKSEKLTKTRKPVQASLGQQPIAIEFGARNGTNREKLILALHANFKKIVPVNDLLLTVYGVNDESNTGALMMVMKGVYAMIATNKLPYEVRKVVGQGYGMFPKGD